MSEGAWTRLYNGYWNTVEPIKECVGLLVAIARERSEAFYLGNVFCTYGTEVPICLMGIWREAPD